MVATSVSLDAHWTSSVRSAVVLSTKVPVARYCWTAPIVMLEVAGVTARLTSSPRVTVRSA